MLVVAKAHIWLDHAATDDVDWDGMDIASCNVERSSVPIDADAAEEILAACRLVVRRARNPAPRFVDLEDGSREEITAEIIDGDLYDFTVGRYFGTTHSPIGDPAVGIVGLMESLSEAGWEPSAERRVALLRACAAIARDLRVETEHLRW